MSGYFIITLFSLFSLEICPQQFFNGAIAHPPMLCHWLWNMPTIANVSVESNIRYPYALSTKTTENWSCITDGCCILGHTSHFQVLTSLSNIRSLHHWRWSYVCLCHTLVNVMWLRMQYTSVIPLSFSVVLNKYIITLILIIIKLAYVGLILQNESIVLWWILKFKCSSPLQSTPTLHGTNVVIVTIVIIIGFDALICVGVQGRRGTSPGWQMGEVLS